MMPNPLQLLILEDNAADAELAVTALERASYACSWDQVQTRKDLVARLDRRPYDLILADHRLPDLDGLTALHIVRERGIEIPFIVCSAGIEPEDLTEVFRAGATDYLSKTQLDRLPSVVHRALASRRRETDSAALLEVATKLQGTLDLSEILDRVHRCVLLRLPCVRVLTFGWNAGSGTFDLLAANAAVELQRADPAGVEVVPPQLIETWAQHGRPDPEGSGMLRARALRSSVKRFGGTAFLSAPLNVNGAVAGMMVAARQGSGGQFGPHTVQLFERIVQQVATAMTTIEVCNSKDDEAEINAALGEVACQLIAGGNSLDLLNRLCRVTTRVLSCGGSYTAMWESSEEAYVPVASHGYTAEEQEALRSLRLPRTELTDLLARLERQDVVPVVPSEIGALSALATMSPVSPSLWMALRRGREVEGIHIATFDKPGADLPRHHRRLGHELATLASLAIENVRLVEELKQANQLKSDFVATMSHELRSPLNSILGYTDLMVETAFGPLSMEQERVLRCVGRSGRRLLDLINATLDVSRLDTGTLPVHVFPTAVGELLEELETDTDEARERSGLRFVWDVPADLPAIETDRVKLKVVMMNLISNAIKFTPHGAVTVTASAREQGVEIAVTDTGVGIAPDVLSVIFEPFRQGDSSSTREFGGVGLGLYIVRRLLELLGGTIDVETRVGGGTTFRVRVPHTIASRQGQNLGTLPRKHDTTFLRQHT